LKCLEVISWPHTKGSVDVPLQHGKRERFITWIQGVSHYSWGMCKTIMTAMLTVKSSMDPHMISWDFGWFGNNFDYVVATTVRSSWSWSFFLGLSSGSWMFLVVLSS
jgi:hypothetical protein